jgi:hypothetical protein
MIPGQEHAIPVGKGPTRRHHAINSVPPNPLPQVLVDLIFHEGVAGGDLVSEHSAVNAGGHDVSNDGIFIKAPEQLVVEVRVVGADLVLHHQLALLQQVLLRHRLLPDREVHGLLELVRQAEVDDRLLGREGLLQVVELHLEELLQERTMVLLVDPV